MVMSIVLLLLILACTIHSVAVHSVVAQNNSGGIVDIDAPYQGAFHSDPSDLYALKQLWSAWNASPDVETNLAGWNALSEEPLNIPCVPDNPWRGVFCNAKSNSTLSAETNKTGWDLEITGLALSNAFLTGVIPDGIGNLTNLVTLSITNNRDLTGDLPIGMQTLYSLFDMDLHGNNITGIIPLWEKDSFAFLQNVNFADNRMVGGLPSNLSFSFRALQTFNLSHNQFSGDFYTIDVFAYLDNLVSVDFSYNQFTGVLPYFTNYTEDGVYYTVTGPLTYLDLSSNEFNESLTSITGHKTLQHFNVSNNRLHGGLDSTQLSNVPTLRELDLSNNDFSGPLPNLVSLENLQLLDLSYNTFEPGSFPTWTMGLKKLQILLLQGVFMTGNLPSSVLANFTNLEILALDRNNLSGTLDLDDMFSMPIRSQTLRLVTLTYNQIQNVAYSGNIIDLVIKFDLTGNPFCDNSTSQVNDLSRCVCQQQCADTPAASSDRTTIIIAITLGSFLLLVVIAIFSVMFWRSRRERYKLILGAEQKFAEYEVKPTIFTYTEMQIFTRAFSIKLGQGAFGAVYKGTLANGVEVAVKQLYTKSQQSLDDFLNEIVLVAAVKHRNLVKLKGCCIRKTQRLLVYEFVENGDLEQFLFGQESKARKDWATRKNICYGVAEGIHYLHFATQPKIIHRDIKLCNILLDKNMEPKIADFGLALLYPETESHIMTIHIAGTRGYLAPEYAHLGQLSEKVDVFSFGVVLLEIVSGRRNMHIKGEDIHFYLPDAAWSLRMDGKLKELIDPTLELQPRDETEALRIINIALLCVHQSGERRPDMKAVLAMLHGGMDAEVSRLLVDHEIDRVRSHGSRATSLSNAVSGTDESISLLSRVYQNSSVEMTSTSRADLPSSVSAGSPNLG